MGVRFYKSVRLLPFLYLNFSKSGVSFSLGAPGAMLNIGAKGVRSSMGLPGTGLSYRKTLTSGTSNTWNGIWRMVMLIVLFAVVGCILAILVCIF